MPYALAKRTRKSTPINASFRLAFNLRFVWPNDLRWLALTLVELRFVRISTSKFVVKLAWICIDLRACFDQGFSLLPILVYLAVVWYIPDEHLTLQRATDISIVTQISGPLKLLQNSRGKRIYSFNVWCIVYTKQHNETSKSSTFRKAAMLCQFCPKEILVRDPRSSF